MIYLIGASTPRDYSGLTVAGYPEYPVMNAADSFGAGMDGFWRGISSQISPDPAPAFSGNGS
ncbi:hypothetical protein [Cupriavidus consociatus]|uniref:hypothetical protein n=1 Tax=Cupriavidus consociatus TaxID=2821357 RepID=UPI001AE8801B|nr:MULTISPECIES: hypothetical protein [unclassified Cupriavidus]MBP0624681.1 hypothetical protein [Cupriavidus sp. LEh25]MDK2661394.1 hypothetical protein [Cupriavidus sp. LEh21]